MPSSRPSPCLRDDPTGSLSSTMGRVTNETSSLATCNENCEQSFRTMAYSVKHLGRDEDSAELPHGGESRGQPIQ